jgi:hypothetical protein
LQLRRQMRSSLGKSTVWAFVAQHEQIVESANAPVERTSISKQLL